MAQVPGLGRRVCGGILGEITFEIRAEEILVKIGRFLGRTWRRENPPFRMISGLSLILANPVNR